MLRYKAFCRYLIGQALSSLGDSLVPLTIAFAALQVGGAGALGLVLAANRVPIAVLVLFGGALGDRWNRRLVMVGADVLRCLVQTVAGVLLVTGSADLWHLVVLQALAGVGTALFTPAANGLMPSLVPAESVHRANALLGLSANANKVVSISTAGALVAGVGPGVALLVDAATFAASAVSLVLLRLPAEARVAHRRSLWTDIRDGARLVAGTPWLRTLLAYSALLQAFVIGPHMIAGPQLAAENYGGAGAWAAIGVVQAVGSVVGGTVALRWRPRRPLYAALAVTLLMVPYLVLYALGAPLWVVVVAAVAIGAQGAFFMSVQSTVLQQRISDASRSRVSSWSQLGNLVLLPASLAVTGPVVALVGGQTVLLCGAAWLVASTLVVVVNPAVRWLGHGTASPTTGEAVSVQGSAG